MGYYKADTYFLSLSKFPVMVQNDPLLEPKKPVLIVSDGEEGNLLEKVIVEQDEPAAAQKPAEKTNDVNSDAGYNTPPEETTP